jgi:phosphatidylglycerol lysyltransferase
MMNGAEKRFSLGWFDENYVRNSRIIIVRAPGGLVSAFANILDEYKKNEVTVDLMRRRPEIENGMMEFLITSAILWAKEKGYETFDLGLSPLSPGDQEKGNNAIEKALRFIYRHINYFYNFRGLHNFKEKFDPEWSPRYLIYPGIVYLPAATLAIIRADAGDDFLREYFISWFLNI